MKRIDLKDIAKLLGQRGGAARAKMLTKARRLEISQHANNAKAKKAKKVKAIMKTLSWWPLSWPCIALLGLLFLSGCGSGGADAPRPPDPVIVGSLTVFPSSASLNVGETQQYTVVAKDTNQNIRQDISVSWSTGTPAVATFDSNGLLTAHAAGSTSVRATHGSVQSQFVTMRVTGSPVTPPVTPVVPPVEPPPVDPPVTPQPPVEPPVVPVPPVTPPVVSLAPLPPWLSYCDGGVCDDVQPVIAVVCEEGHGGCRSTRSTSVIPQVDGVPISGAVLVVNYPSRLPVNILSGYGDSNPGVINAYLTNGAVEVRSDQDLTFSFYALQANWGGTVPLNFVSSQHESPEIRTVFYRHPSYHIGNADSELHAKAKEVMRIERELTGIYDSQKVLAYFVPTEMTASIYHGGSASYGNGVLSVSYGSPQYLEDNGGLIMNPVGTFSHEFAHDLFNSISWFFPGNYACLNEGIANVTGFVSGFIPEERFGMNEETEGETPDRCLDSHGIHSLGICPFFYVKQAGHLTPAFIRGLFNPQHKFVFDSCVMNKETGDSLLVYFSEASGGADMIPVLDATKIPHSATYAEAKKALGFL